jgi:hypothetical protein
VKDQLFVHRVAPNEMPAKDYLQQTYGPQAQKTFTGALEAFFATEFPQLAGERARRAVVQGIVDLVHRFHPETSHLRSGQTAWVSVAKDETAAYGKTIPKTRMVSTVVTLIADDEAASRRDGKRLRQVKIDAIARVCNEIDAQGGCVTAAELAIMFKTTPTTVGRHIAAWEEDHKILLPRRGTIHDMGPTLTHKKEICRLLFIDSKTVAETCRITKHSTRAVVRYITNFRQVFTCKTKGLDLNETSRATKLSKRLVEEYYRLFEDYAVTDAKFDLLLKNNVTNP